MAGATWHCCRLGTRSVYTIQPRTRFQCHFIPSQVRRVHVCSAVTCHLHFWQNDLDLLRATAVTRGWNGYRKKSQHRKLTLGNKILPRLLPGLEPATFRSQVRRSNRWATPAPFGTQQVSELPRSTQLWLFNNTLLHIYKQQRFYFTRRMRLDSCTLKR